MAGRGRGRGRKEPNLPDMGRFDERSNIRLFSMSEGGEFKVRTEDGNIVAMLPTIYIRQITEEEYQRLHTRRPALDRHEEEERIPEESQNIVQLTDESPPTEPEVTNEPEPVLHQECMGVDSVAGVSTTVTKTVTVEDKANDGGKDKGPLANSRLTSTTNPVGAGAAEGKVSLKMVASAVQRMLQKKPKVTTGASSTLAPPSAVVSGPARIREPRAHLSSPATSRPVTSAVIRNRDPRPRPYPNQGFLKKPADISSGMGNISIPGRSSTAGPTGLGQGSVGIRSEMSGGTTPGRIRNSGNPIYDYYMSKEDRGKLARTLPRIPRKGEAKARSGNAVPVAGPSGVGAAPSLYMNMAAAESIVPTAFEEMETVPRSASIIPPPGNLTKEEWMIAELEEGEVGGKEDESNADAPWENP